VSHRAVAAALTLAALGAAGCESTVDKADNLAKEGSSAFKRKGLGVTAVDASIHVVRARVLHDASGSAAVVELRNSGRRAIRDAPIAIDVRDGHGKTVFRNDAAGLQASLSRVPLLPAGKTVVWVNDQVQATAPPRKVLVRVGRGTPATEAPDLPVDGVHLAGDPVSGLEAAGRVRNATGEIQHNVVVSAVARKHAKVVAAGRSLIPAVAPGKTQNFHVFFIGNPRGAELSVSTSVASTPKKPS
jgi:hypothetical protein